MIDNEAIRDALRVIAADAPSTRDVLAGLAERQRLHRQRRLLVTVAGVGAAAATAGLAGLSVRQLLASDDAFPSIVGGPGGGWLQVPLRHRPTWLPGGYGQAGAARRPGRRQPGRGHVPDLGVPGLGARADHPDGGVDRRVARFPGAQPADRPHRDSGRQRDCRPARPNGSGQHVPDLAAARRRPAHRHRAQRRRPR
ncbi:MAG TPA: hypothetical protein VFC19_27120 [Candidatus Limnocylindrales bacterium]|nr:hypothetical protein [Candidatus Limnocylindrales bacterium]